MTDNDKSLDLTGIGKLAKAVPPSAWNRLVKTACDTFTQLLGPFTASTEGVSRLIKAKFDRMVDVQKVLAADTLQKAKNKINRIQRQPKESPRAQVLVKAIEAASSESDDNLREIWANLIANELLDNRVHPEFPRILERLSSDDALILANVAESSKKSGILKAMRAILYSLDIKMGMVNLSPLLIEEATDFSHAHLRNLHLITKTSGEWSLTLIGESFLKAVADPSYEEKKSKQANSEGLRSSTPDS